MTARTEENGTRRRTALDFADGINLPTDYAFRGLTTDDAEAVAALMNDHARSVGDHDGVTAEFVQGQWASAQFELADGAIAIVAGTGEVIGYEEVFDHGAHTILGTYGGLVHPSRTGIGLGAALVRWAERRAKVHADLADPAIDVVVRVGLERRDTAGQDRLERMGYRIVRHFWEMERDLSEPIESPRWPEGLEVRSMQPGQERQFHEVERESFADHWGMAPISAEDAWIRFQDILRSDPFIEPALLFGAWDGDELAGICFTTSAHEGDPTIGWIADLGVLKPWRRRGIGEALLLHSFDEFRRRGLPRAGLGVDAANDTGATDLYERAGMKVVRRYEAFEKTIREAHGPPKESAT